MVNITIFQNGEVTGDNGKIIAYVGEEYSQPIHIVHPLFSHISKEIEYYVEYKYNQTIYKNKLDENGVVRLKVENAGYMKCQLVAIDTFNTEIVFKSKTWNFIIQETLKVEPSHYPCSITEYYNGHKEYNATVQVNNCNCNNDSCNAKYQKLIDELQNEEDIRFSEIVSLKSDIIKIKELLNIDQNTASYLNANEIINSGKYLANKDSINFPKTNQPYKLIVTNENGFITQQAFETTSNEVSFRSGITSNGTTIWESWQNISINNTTI